MPIPSGVFTGLFSLAGFISSATGHPALGMFFNDPHTAELATNVMSGVGALLAGFLPGLKK